MEDIENVKFQYNPLCSFICEKKIELVCDISIHMCSNVLGICIWSDFITSHDSSAIQLIICSTGTLALVLQSMQIIWTSCSSAEQNLDHHRFLLLEVQVILAGNMDTKMC